MTATTISSDGKYYQVTERDVERISVCWKASHVAIFFAIALCSFTTAWAFASIFSDFGYRCMLYSSLNITSNSNRSRTTTTTTTTTVEPTVVTTTLMPDEDTTIFTTENPLENNTDVVVAPTNGKVEFNGRLAYSSRMTCDLVLLVPLISFIVSTFLGVVVILCSRGGTGYSTDLLRAVQNVVYPMLIISCIFAIVFIIEYKTFTTGFEAFCANFDHFTGTKECARIDNIKMLVRASEMPLFTYFETTKYAACGCLALWCGQIALCVLRMYKMVDYNVYNLEVEEENADEDTTMMEDISLDTTERTSKL